MSKLESYWLDSRPRFTGAATEPLPARAACVVIGGGFTGLSAARSLAMQGADVVLLEAGAVASEASGRNGGHCNNGLATDLGALGAQLGMDRARALYRAFDDAVDRVEAVVAEERIDCDFTRNGKMKLAAKPEHAEKLARGAELLAREVEPDLRLLSRAELRQEIGTDAFYAGLVLPRSASMHVGRFGVGLAEAAVRRGARVYEQAAVTGLQRIAGRRYKVTSTRGTIEADQVLLATGTSLRGPFAWLRRRVIPIGSYIVATRPLDPGLVAQVMPGRRNCSTSKIVGHYFRLTSDDRLIFGGRARFAMPGPTSDPKSGEILRRDLHRIFPVLRDVPIEYVWGGLLDMTMDRLPRAGERDGLYFVAGLSGHGVQMSVLMGDRMARVMGGDGNANPLAGLDWPAVPGHFGPPWFLPLVGLYYRVQDWRH
jgi:glycine/D-amino acid oxidase-like deaminating enzyme